MNGHASTTAHFWEGEAVRATRVLYVENDPVLRTIMTRLLAAEPGLEVIATAGTSDEAMDGDAGERADVALIDLALGGTSLNGLDLGLALRKRNPNLGVVIFSQHAMSHLARRVPEAERMGWSFVAKTGTMELSDLVDTLRATARGMSIGGTAEQRASGEDLLERMTGRQRAVMSLVAAGLNAPQIGVRLHVTADVVRQDLSKAYRILVPDGSTSGDLRTQAVLAYLRLVDRETWAEE